MNGSELHDEVARALANIDATVTAAEAQGMLCGLFCAPTPPEMAQWIAQVLEGLSPKGEPAREALETLAGLYQDTHDRLENDILEFAPLLPDDEAELNERATALARWCEGFLFGLGLANGQAGGQDGGQVDDQVGAQVEGLPREANEAISDIGQIAQLDPDTPADEDSEIAYTELVEYLRAATLLLREHTALPSNTKGSA